MNLSISNIAWDSQNDQAVYDYIRSAGFTGLEIAPTKLFGADAYLHLSEAESWHNDLYNTYSLKISSMQSIWFGRNESVFGTDEERESLLKYTMRAIDFAEIVGCKNLVFGCPKNRVVPEGIDPDISISFFRTLGDYAYDHNTVLAMEANPTIYNTNFINTTSDAFSLIDKVKSKGFLLNLDVGTMVANNEDVSVLSGKAHLINHVHISEPYLAPIAERELHKELSAFLKDNDYSGYISIEMKTPEETSVLFKTIDYVTEVFR